MILAAFPAGQRPFAVSLSRLCAGSQVSPSDRAQVKIPGMWLRGPSSAFTLATCEVPQYEIPGTDDQPHAHSTQPPLSARLLGSAAKDSTKALLPIRPARWIKEERCRRTYCPAFVTSGHHCRQGASGS